MPNTPTGDGIFGFDEKGELSIQLFIYPNRHIQLGIGHDVTSAGPEYDESQEGKQFRFDLIVARDSKEQGPALRIVSFEKLPPDGLNWE